MPSIINADKIGTLSYSAPNVTLGPSLVTVGGQQYRTLTSLTANTGTLTANTLYCVYVVISGGTPQLVVSTNVNSAGPSGYSRWKLVGAFYSNGLVSVGFGYFLNITGTPKGFDLADWTPTGAWTTNTTYTGKVVRDGGDAIINTVLNLAGAPNAAALFMNMPAGLSIRISDYITANLYIGDGHGQGHQGGTGYNFQVGNLTSAGFALICQTTLTTSQQVVNATTPITWAAGGQVIVRNLRVPVVGWNNTPIEEL